MVQKENEMNPRWIETTFFGKIDELVPYEKCPRCGEFRYRKLRKRGSYRYRKFEDLYHYWFECKNCKYRSDM